MSQMFWLLSLLSMLTPQAAGQPTVPTATDVRAALKAGEPDRAWKLIAAMPVSGDTVDLAVEVALSAKAPEVDRSRLPLLADRAARLFIEADDRGRRLTACAIVTRLDGSVPCGELLMGVTTGQSGTAIDRARAWVALRVMGGTPAALPAGWEGEVRGASALELAAWPDLPAASRVRLLEPLLSSQDIGAQIAAIATLQTVPGPEALAAWRRLSDPARVPPPPTYPGARTQIQVGLARVGDAEALKVVTPVESQLSSSDRLVLAMGRLERGDPAGRAALITLVNSGNEVDAVRAAEALGQTGPEPRIAARVRAFVRDVGPPLRARWLQAAARLQLGNTPEVVRHLTDPSDDVRVAAAVAVAVAATAPPPVARR